MPMLRLYFRRHTPQVYTSAFLCYFIAMPCCRPDAAARYDYFFFFSMPLLRCYCRYYDAADYSYAIAIRLMPLTLSSATP